MSDLLLFSQQSPGRLQHAIQQKSLPNRTLYGGRWQNSRKGSAPAYFFRSLAASHHPRLPPFSISKRRLFVSGLHEPESIFNRSMRRRVEKRSSTTQHQLYLKKGRYP